MTLFLKYFISPEYIVKIENPNLNLMPKLQIRFGFLFV
jgi:hypothetical protein